MESEKGKEINEEEEEIKETKAPTKVAGESCWKNKLVESDARSVLFNTFDYNLIYISWTYNNNVNVLYLCTIKKDNKQGKAQMDNTLDPMSRNLDFFSSSIIYRN